MRGVRYRGFGNGTHGGTYPSSGIVFAESVDRGRGENHKKPERARVVPRVPEFEEKVVGRGDMGRRLLCPDSRRPDDSGRYHEVYSTSSRTRARACAASFEAALLMPRGLPRGYLLESNNPSIIRKLTRLALTTQSERRRIEALTELKGVSLPMASAILMLVDPKRYGVIDIRVWQLLYMMKFVRSNPRGAGFNFKHWYHYLRILRYHAKENGVTARNIERTLFLCHKKLQKGNLYSEKPGRI